MILSRRRFFGLLAAPAVIRVADLMPVKTPRLVGFEVKEIVWNASPGTARYFATYDDDKNLVASWDYGESLTVADGESFTIDFGAEFVSLT
jgi:hypothetical protein